MSQPHAAHQLLDEARTLFDEMGRQISLQRIFEALETAYLLGYKDGTSNGANIAVSIVRETFDGMKDRK